MSTFNGYVKEFPHLAIDYFRPRLKSAPPVLAYLLSHVHADHLQGLENHDFGAAFIYCTQATKNLLLRIQERNSRVNYARGEADLQARKYAHLGMLNGRRRNLLRVLPLYTPTLIQLGQNPVMVTLFDANHCPGAVMFLIESDSHAVLYTGDMRAESTFQARFFADPLMSQYTSGLRLLDCIYLDTSARIGGPEYATKADGCAQLIRAIAQYPRTTNFYFNARCIGYEDLWLNIGRAFDAKVHVDRYRKALFQSIADSSYEYGRVLAQGPDSILTTDSSSTRFHSCESIDPCAHRPSENEEVYIKTVNSIVTLQGHKNDGSQVGLADFGEEVRLKTFPVDEENSLIGQDSQSQSTDSINVNGKVLPMVLVVPFARHSSWPELVRFVTALRPRRVHSCTGDVGRHFDEFCHNHQSNIEQGDEGSTSRIEHYAALTRAGLWHESPHSKRQRLIKDVNL